MNLIDSKSILAKLMATENLTIEQRNVQTASFDVLNRVLVVPTLDNKISSSLYDLFMGHEVGHALYTPVEDLKKAKDEGMNLSILNVVEDSRIERKIKYKYPGLKNSFNRGYKELFERDFFGTKGININELNFIDRINIHCKGGASMVVRFDNEEKTLLDEVENTETYKDVLEVTRKIIELMKLQKERKEEELKLKKAARSDEDNAGEDEMDYDESSGFESSDNDFIEESSFDDEDSEDLNSSGSEDFEFANNEIKSFTDEAFSGNQSKLFAQNSDTYTYVNVPKFDTSKIVDYKFIYKKIKGEDRFTTNNKSYIEHRNSSNKIVSYLVKEFEMRKNAEQLKRASVAKTGDLNMNRIFSYHFSEDIFKKITVVPGGKSHGLVLFLDWSGSMSNHLLQTIKQLLNLTAFCKKTMIPFEVYIFISTEIDSSGGADQRKLNPIIPVVKPKEGDLFINQFGIYNILSSRMTASEYSFAANFLLKVGAYPRYAPSWMSLSGTPLNEAVIASMEIVPEFKRKHKLQIVNTIFLTDGEGHSLYNKFVYNNVKKLSYTNIKSDPLNPQIKHKYLVIRDPVTRNEEITNMQAFLGIEQNVALISLLKKRTNTNVIGFYIAQPRELEQYLRKVFVNNKAIVSAFDSDIEKFKKEKHLVIQDCGYNEYYALKAERDAEEESSFVVKENATKRGLVSAFNKFSKSKVNNRIVLNRFIGLIS